MSNTNDLIKIPSPVQTKKFIESKNNKRLRFHPSYYQSRKGTFMHKNPDSKKIPVKIQKIIKKQDELVLFIANKKTREKQELVIEWKDLEFDYFDLKTSYWNIKLSRK